MCALSSRFAAAAAAETLDRACRLKNQQQAKQVL
jgi:hypothetical protein